MEATRFDRLARAFGAATTRRMAIAAGMAVLVGGTVDTSAATFCRQTMMGCTRASQCCSGHCEKRATAPRRQRHRCGCLGGATFCNGQCCALGQTCDAGTCTDPCGSVAGLCYGTADGAEIVPGNTGCVVIDDTIPCLAGGACPCAPGATCACIVNGYDTGAKSETWVSGACATVTPRGSFPHSCCPTEEYCNYACVDVQGDNPGNCGACGQVCESPRVCSGGTCTCNEDWCTHYCAQGSAEWLCAELQDGTFIEACSDGYTAREDHTCTTDLDCIGYEPNVPTIGGGCIKHAFINQKPASYSGRSNSGFCGWFTRFGATTCGWSTTFGATTYS